jgi:hypothetical protein
MRFQRTIVALVIGFVSSTIIGAAASAQPGPTPEDVRVRDQQNTVAVVEAEIPKLIRDARWQLLFGQCDAYRRTYDHIIYQLRTLYLAGLPQRTRNELVAKHREQMRTLPEPDDCERRNGVRHGDAAFNNTGGVRFGANINVGKVDGDPTSFLGVRHPITGLELRGIVKPDGDTNVTGGGVSMSIPLPRLNAFRLLENQAPAPQPRVFFNYNFFDGNTRQHIPDFDPLGQNLLVPGAGDNSQPFPAGVSLGGGVPLGTPGGANVARNIFFSRDISSRSFSIKLASGPIPIGSPGGLFGGSPNGTASPQQMFDRAVTVSGSIGYAYDITKLDEHMQFSIPGFLTDVAYDSQVTVNTHNPFIGGRLDVPLFVNDRNRLSVFLKGRAGLAISNAEGTDRFVMNGFLNTNQSVSLSANNTSFAGMVGGGLRLRCESMLFTGSVTHAWSDTMVNVFRSGETNQPSMLNFDRLDNTTFRAEITKLFGPPSGF